MCGPGAPSVSPLSYIYVPSCRVPKILRSIYLDQFLDEALALRAEAERTTKTELMRAYIAAGLERPARMLGHEQAVADARSRGPRGQRGSFASSDRR
ncbi:MAG: ribbon-helix-helix protein, CopG family [Deltaproteobacteria bacterium]|nr:MAG: ribbon-helix-helix protein, CopG family [Deltaproteobacteria bacterium]